MDANHDHQLSPGDYWSIRLSSALPTIRDSVTLDGWSQGGAGYHGQPLVELDGRKAGPGAEGLVFSDHQGSTLRGLIINRFHGNGVVLEGGGHNLVGNFIGTNATGQRAAGNQLAGVLLNASADNIIGGAGRATSSPVTTSRVSTLVAALPQGTTSWPIGSAPPCPAMPPWPTAPTRQR